MKVFMEFIGFLSGSIAFCSFFPQIIKSIKTKSTKDLAVLTYVMYAINNLLSIIYGLYFGRIAIWMTNSIAFCFAASMIILKIKYSKNSNNKNSSITESKCK
jgi:MtN3 and saliva related transmembrane protein